jgi:hypothetical protein
MLDPQLGEYEPSASDAFKSQMAALCSERAASSRDQVDDKNN